MNDLSGQVSRGSRATDSPEPAATTSADSESTKSALVIQLSNRIIGTGSFSVVYKATMKRSGANQENITGNITDHQTTVAVKVVNRSKLNRKLLHRLQTEIQIMRTIHHPNIIQLLDIQYHDQEIWIVMDYCDLGDLSSFIKRTKAQTQRDHSGVDGGLKPVLNGLPDEMILHFLRQLSSALWLLRQKNIIHRDLKPQNLLLSKIPTEKYPCLKLADFGFARYLQKFDMADTLCGSPLYMAPEILKHEKYDSKADLWSVGTILYEMVTGSPPFKAPNHIALLKKIQNTERVLFPDESIRGSLISPVATLQKNQLRSFRAGSFTATSSLSTNLGVQYDYGSSVPSSLPGSYNKHGSPAGLILQEEQESNHELDLLTELKEIARRLLMQRPAERMTFDEFFNHPLLYGCGTSQESFMVRTNTSSSRSTRGFSLNEQSLGGTLPRPIPDRGSSASSSSSNPASLKLLTSVRQRPQSANTSLSFGEPTIHVMSALKAEPPQPVVIAPQKHIGSMADRRAHLPEPLVLESISFPPRTVLSPCDDLSLQPKNAGSRRASVSSVQTPGTERQMEGSWMPPFEMDDLAQNFENLRTKQENHAPMNASGNGPSSLPLEPPRPPSPMPFATSRISPILIGSSMAVARNRNYQSRDSVAWPYLHSANSVAHYAFQWLQTGYELAKPGLDAIWPRNVQNQPLSSIASQSSDNRHDEDDGYVIVDETSP